LLFLASTPVGTSVFAYTIATLGLAPQDSAAGRYEEQDAVLTIRLRPTGPESREISIPAGSYWLNIDNTTGIEEPLTINVLSGDKETVLLTRTLAPRQDDLVHLPPLTPGEFYVTEASHPNIGIHVVVTP